MVHSEHILIAFLQLKIYIKKCLTIYMAISIFFFKTTLVNDNAFYIVNVHLNNEVVLIPFWFPPVNGGLRWFLFSF